MKKLLRRVGVGAVLIAVVLAAIYFHYVPLLLLVAAWSFMAGRELTELLRKQGIRLPAFFISGLTLAYPALYLLGRESGKVRLTQPDFLLLLAPLAIIVVYGLLTRAPRGSKLAFSVFALLYVGLLPFHLVLLRVYAFEHLERPFPVVLYPLLVTWINDTGAYGFGKLLGRRKLAPELSPNKTREGFIAGVLLAAGFSALYLPWCLGRTNRVEAAFLGLVLGVVAQAGDLVESIFKREAGVKDSSSALSEHGGFLDRADSLLFTIPIFFYYLT